MTQRISDISIGSIDQAGDDVIVTVQFTAPRTLSVVDLVDLNLSGDVTEAGVIRIETSPDGATWTPLGSDFRFGGGARTRRAAFPAGEAAEVSHVRVRIVDLATLDGRSLDIARIDIYDEAEDLSAVRCFPFTYEEDARYMMILSDLSMAVYKQGAAVADLPTVLPAGLLSRCDYTQSLSTMLLFHEQRAPWRVFRQGDDSEWDSRVQPIEDLPRVEFDDATYTNGTNEVQRLDFQNWGFTETYNLTLDGETSGAATFSATPADNVAAIENAINSLEVLDGGTVSVAYITNGIYEITFDGGKASQTDWPQIVGNVVQSTDGFINTTTITKGENGGEDPISDARGWPRCGAFNGPRLLLGGLRSLPKTILLSRDSEFFDFGGTGRRATDGYTIEVNATENDGVRAIRPGRFIEIFTGAEQFFVASDVMSAEDVQRVVRAGENGLQVNTRPAGFDDTTIFIEAGGQALRAYVYSEEARSYRSPDMTVRAPFLMDRPLDLCVRRAGYEHKTALALIPKEDGEMTGFVRLADQNVNALVRFNTPDGKFVACGAERLGDAYCIVERRIAGEDRHYIETLTPGRMLDSSILVEHIEGQPIEVAHLEREDVYVVSGEQWSGPHRVEDGIITTDLPSGTYEVGLFFDAHGIPMDVRIEDPRGTSQHERKRMVKAVVSIHDSMVPGIDYLGREFVFPSEALTDRAYDVGEAMLLESGRRELVGFLGWSREIKPRLFRKYPGPLHIRSLQMEVMG